MPQRVAVPVGAPCWVDLFTSDPERIQSFFGELFGWTAEASGEEYGGYVNFSKDGALVAGCMHNDGQAGAPDVWSVYLYSTNARATLTAAVANGGQVVLDALEVMDLGTMAMVTDAGRAATGVWQPGRHRGFDVVGEPGTAAWFELQTRDYDASVRFYRKVFRWRPHVASNVPGFRYTTLGKGDAARAGIMDASAVLADGIPPHWSVYFRVEDVDATLAKILELGGSVMAPAETTPFGRLASAADPTGAVFKLLAEV